MLSLKLKEQTNSLKIVINLNSLVKVEEPGKWPDCSLFLVFFCHLLKSAKKRCQLIQPDNHMLALVIVRRGELEWQKKTSLSNGMAYNDILT